MKTLNNVLAAFAIMMLLLASSCKKDVVKVEPEKFGSFTYQNKTYDITSAEYRRGNGNGAWIYLMTSDLNTVQIRFAGVADYAIPEGKMDYVNLDYAMPQLPNKNFMGGQVIINSTSNVYNVATVTITKNGNKHVITLNAATPSGSLKANFEGILKKI